MQAAQINQQGDASVIHITSSAPRPPLGSGEVLVHIKAAGVNAADWKIRSGKLQNPMSLDYPVTLGGDAAGIVAEISEGVKGFTIGDEVFGQGDFRKYGTFAEYAPISSDHLALKPKTASFIEAAALPTVGLCAYQMVYQKLDIHKGQSVLVQGASGGMGSVVVQLAKHLGARVTSTAATEDIVYVRTLGSDEVIDYTHEALETATLAPFDFVIDMTGSAEVSEHSMRLLKRGGTYISPALLKPNEILAKELSVRAIPQLSNFTSETLSTVAKLYDEGIFKLHIDRTFPLTEAAQAINQVETGKKQGKIVITVDA